MCRFLSLLFSLLFSVSGFDSVYPVDLRLLLSLSLSLCVYLSLSLFSLLAASFCEDALLGNRGVLPLPVGDPADISLLCSL